MVHAAWSMVHARSYKRRVKAERAVQRILDESIACEHRIKDPARNGEGYVCANSWFAEVVQNARVSVSNGHTERELRLKFMHCLTRCDGNRRSAHLFL